MERTEADAAATAFRYARVVRLRAIVAAALALTASAAMLSLGCSDRQLDLTIDVKTDLVSGLEFAQVQTVLGPASATVAASSLTEIAAHRGDSYARGARVAEIHALAAGNYSLRVRLLDSSGAVVLERTTAVTLTHSTAVTVLLSRDCRGVVCPGTGDGPAASICLGGRCVTDDCLTGGIGCPTPECTVDSDCPVPSACARTVCAEATCFDAPDQSRCAATEVCIPDRGCVPDPGMVDASVTLDAGVTSVDAAAPDAGVEPDDAGLPPMDAGVAPECVVDADCGATSYGAWGACSYSSTCDTGASRTRSVTQHTCTAGSCSTSTTPETGSCSRSTDGITCSATTYGAWGACGYADVCDEAATQSRSVSAHTCAGGVCGTSGSSESRACTRSTTGVSCGRASCLDRCLGGVCELGCAPMCPC